VIAKETGKAARTLVEERWEKQGTDFNEEELDNWFA
jgi:hypothetical protein